MDQYTLGLDPLPKKTRKEVFLDEMNRVVPWAMLVALITPIKQQFGYAKVRYSGLEKNTARLTMLFALSNLWMARKRIMALQG